MRNLQREMEALEREIEQTGKVPTLLLHSCCAPCSSAVLERLTRLFSVTVFYFNPNIEPAEEYRHRIEEQKRLIAELPADHPVSFLEGGYEPERFYRTVAGLEEIPEGGARCFACYKLRLREAARAARDGGFDWFATTLSVSPLKNAEKLAEIGEAAGAEYGVRYLPSDFKKRDGYKRSVELSKLYGLYRQNYCGCVFSKKEAAGRAKKEAVG